MCGAPASVTSRLLPLPRKNQFFRVMVPSKVAFTGVPTGVLKSTPLCFRPSLSSEVICSQLSSGDGLQPQLEVVTVRAVEPGELRPGRLEAVRLEGAPGVRALQPHRAHQRLLPWLRLVHHLEQVALAQVAAGTATHHTSDPLHHLGERRSGVGAGPGDQRGLERAVDAHREEPRTGLHRRRRDRGEGRARAPPSIPAR